MEHVKLLPLVTLDYIWYIHVEFVKPLKTMVWMTGMFNNEILNIES